MSTAPTDLPPEPGSKTGYLELEELVDQVVEITAIEELKGIPIAVIGGRRYLVTDEWGEECAGKLQSLFATQGAESFTVLIKRAANGDVGMAPPPAS